jgi:hypothetical protein
MDNPIHGTASTDIDDGCGYSYDVMKVVAWIRLQVGWSAQPEMRLTASYESAGTYKVRLGSRIPSRQ